MNTLPPELWVVLSSSCEEAGSIEEGNMLFCPTWFLMWSPQGPAAGGPRPAGGARTVRGCPRLPRPPDEGPWTYPQTLGRADPS